MHFGDPKVSRLPQYGQLAGALEPGPELEAPELFDADPSRGIELDDAIPWPAEEGDSTRAGGCE